MTSSGAAIRSPAGTELGWKLLATGITGVLLAATLGEGGGSPAGLAVWHAGLVAVWISTLLLSTIGSHRSLAAAPAAGLALFASLVFAGALLAPYGYAGLLTCVELVVSLSIVWLAARLGPELLLFLRWPLGLWALGEALWVAAQKFLLAEARPAGTFLNTNHLAGWMVVVLLLSFGAHASDERRAPRLLNAACIAAAGSALWLSGSRGALLGLLVASAWWLAVGWTKLSVPRRRAAVLAALLLVAVTGWRLELRLREGDPFFFQRARIWKASITLFLERPLWGTRAGQFETAASNAQFPDGEGPLRYDRRFGVAHSDAIRLFAEFGAPAASALLAAIALGVRHRRRGRRAAGRSVVERAAMAGLLAIGTQALVDNPSRWPALYLLAGALAGALLSVPSEAARRLSRAHRASLALLLGLSYLVVDLGPTLAYEELAALPRGRLSVGQRERLQRARIFNPIHPDAWLRSAEDLAGDGVDWDLESYARAREWAERAIRLDPASALHAWRRARIEALACRTLFADAASRARADAAFRHAESLSRFNALIPAERAGFLLDTGEPTEARRAAQRALELEPESVLPRLLLAEALLDAGTPVGAERAAQLLAQARARSVPSAGLRGHNAYARELLVAREGALARIEQKLERADASAERGATRPGPGF